MTAPLWLVLGVVWGQPEETTVESPVSIPEIVVSGRRVAGVARPDTTVRLTGKQIVERGLTTLAEALDQILDADVRAAGRGGLQVNIRGARKGGVLLILDGVVVSDPFNGNFDVSSIPATDIAEIRVSLTPASPLDGPGGNGGVVEVLTRPASGPATVRALLQSSTAPSGVAAVTGRAPIAGAFGARVSATGALGMRDFTPPGAHGPGVKEDARSGAAALRVERNDDRTRTALDLAFSRRSFLVPPAEEPSPSDVPSYDLRFIDREDVLRAGLSGETGFGGLRLSAHAFSLLIDRSDSFYRDASRRDPKRLSQDRAHRSGANAQLDFSPSSDLRLTLIGHWVIEGGRESARDVVRGVSREPMSDGGISMIAEPALGLSYAPTEWLRIDGAAGVAAPIGSSASAWPEAKVGATITPMTAIEVRATLARKGRLPTLRDRFDPLNGNQSLRPELGTSAEGGVDLRPHKALSLHLDGYYRLTADLIRFATTGGGGGQLTNIGDITVRGFEARVEATPLSAFSMGAGYAFADASPPIMRRSPLDFFPAHRAEVWASLRDGRRLGVFGRVRYAGERQDGPRMLAGYATVDGSAWVRIDDLQLTLRAENLLGQSYEARASVPGSGRTIYFGIQGTLQ